MARYRKIDVRMWNDRKFRELSDNAKLVFILLLTHPDTTQIGTIRTRVSNLADELGWQRDAMSHAIQEVTLNGMIDADEKAGLMVINNFLKYNAPSSPNAFKSWRELIDLMPECDLLDRHVASLKAFVDSLSTGMRNAIPNDLMDAIKDAILRVNEQPSRIQEQEQEQEIYTHTEKSEKQSAVAENFAGRECEKPVSLKTEAIEEELPLEEQEASVSKKEIVEPKPKKEVKTQRLQKPEELTDEFWQDFLAYRKQKKAPVTERVISLLRKEAKKAGWTLEEVINEMMVRNWTGFKADWVKDDWKDPNAHWVSASEYNKELPPVTYSTGAKNKFVEKLHAGMRAYDIKDLPNNKEQR
nr:MAG TPA: replisome organizer [Caudoviricetes sp.]